MNVAGSRCSRAWTTRRPRRHRRCRRATPARRGLIRLRRAILATTPRPRERCVLESFFRSASRATSRPSTVADASVVELDFDAPIRRAGPVSATGCCADRRHSSSTTSSPPGLRTTTRSPTRPMSCAAAAAAQLPVPQACVSPTPRSHTLMSPVRHGAGAGRDDFDVLAARLPTARSRQLRPDDRQPRRLRYRSRRGRGGDCRRRRGRRRGPATGESARM